MTTAVDERVATFHNGLTPSNGGAIRVSNLWKRYGSLEAVRGIEFEVRKGGIFGLIGPDGAGKTTTFQILAGVMKYLASPHARRGRRPVTSRKPSAFTRTSRLPKISNTPETCAASRAMRSQAAAGVISKVLVSTASLSALPVS